MIPLFADTFYFLAPVHAEDTAHERALRLAKARTDAIITTVWVLTEVADALAAPSMRATFPRLLASLCADPACTIVPPSSDLFERGAALYSDRPDKSWSLTDCISFVVMQEGGITQALTGDRHFEQAGFTALLK